jgi:hypothetical protein
VVGDELLSGLPSGGGRPTGNARYDIAAADHIEAVTPTLRVHAPSQLRSVSWQGRGRTEVVDLAARSIPLHTRGQSSARGPRCVLR